MAGKLLSLGRPLIVTMLALIAACSNPIGAVVGSTTVVCSGSPQVGGGMCTISRNFPSSEQSTLVNDCTNEGGKVVSACPTNGLVGCCTTNDGEFSIEDCYYSGAVSQLKSDCGGGTWSTSP